MLINILIKSAVKYFPKLVSLSFLRVFTSVIKPISFSVPINEPNATDSGKSSICNLILAYDKLI